MKQSTPNYCSLSIEIDISYISTHTASSILDRFLDLSVLVSSLTIDNASFRYFLIFNPFYCAALDLSETHINDRPH